MSQAAAKTQHPASAAQARSRPAGRAERQVLGASASDLNALQGMAGNAAVSNVLGAGRPLPVEVREAMESRFGAAFDDVRIHDDPQGQASAAELQARAYTVGTDVVFGASQYAPESPSGQQLLAHELAHVVQQRRGGPAPELSPEAPHEASADRAAAQVAHGASAVTVSGGTAVGIARNAILGDKPPPKDEPATQQRDDPELARAEFIRMFREFRRHDRQFWMWMAKENALNPGRLFRGLYAWMGSYGFGQSCKVNSGMEDMLADFDAAVLRWSKATHGRYIPNRELTDPFAMAPVYDPEAYERRMNEVILQALPDGRGYMGTRRGFQAAERRQILDRQMQTLANVEGSIFGAIGAGIGGDVGSDIGSAFGDMFLAWAPTVQGKSEPQPAQRPDVTLVERAPPKEAETPGGPPKSLVTAKGLPPPVPPAAPASPNVTPPVTPPSSSVAAKSVAPPVPPSTVARPAGEPGADTPVTTTPATAKQPANSTPGTASTVNKAQATTPPRAGPRIEDPYGMRPDEANFDRRTAGAGGIDEISFLKDPDGRYAVKIKGKLQEGLYRGKGKAPANRIKAPNYNRSRKLVSNKEAGLTADWENAHLWGPGFGDEAAAGMMKAPRSVNQWYQNEGIEGWARDLRKAAGAVPKAGGQGAQVEVEATAIAWDLQGKAWQPKAQVDFLKRAEYRVKLTTPAGETASVRVTIDVAPPPGNKVTVSFDPPTAANPADLLRIIKGTKK